MTGIISPTLTCTFNIRQPGLSILYLLIFSLLLVQLKGLRRLLTLFSLEYKFNQESKCWTWRLYTFIFRILSYTLGEVYGVFVP